MPTTVSVSDLHAAAWLAANEYTFIDATVRGSRVTFNFDDPDATADQLLGRFFRDDTLKLFAMHRGRFAWMTRALQEARRTTMSAQELESLRIAAPSYKSGTLPR